MTVKRIWIYVCVNPLSIKRKKGKKYSILISTQTSNPFVNRICFRNLYTNNNKRRRGTKSRFVIVSFVGFRKVTKNKK